MRLVRTITWWQADFITFQLNTEAMYYNIVSLILQLVSLKCAKAALVTGHCASAAVQTKKIFLFLII